MSYHETLARMIKESGLTLRELAEKIKTEYGVKIDQSYISKLQSGKQAPASEEVNIALAKACNADKNELLFEAYIDKAPETIQKFMSNTVSFFKFVAKNLFKAQLPKHLSDTLEQHFKEIPKWEIIKEILKEDNWPEVDQDGTFYFKSNDPKFKNVLMATNPLFGIPMPDNSMEPIIPKGAMLQMDEPTKAEENDIVLVEIDNQRFIRRYIPMGNKMILIAENSKFKPITGDKKTMVIVAKIKSFTKEL